MDSAQLMVIPPSNACTDLLAANIPDSKSSGFLSDDFSNMLTDTILAFQAQDIRVNSLSSDTVTAEGLLDATSFNALTEKIPAIAEAPETAISTENNMALIQAQMMALQVMPAFEQPAQQPEITGFTVESTGIFNNNSAITDSMDISLSTLIGEPVAGKQQEVKNTDSMDISLLNPAGDPVAGQWKETQDDDPETLITKTLTEAAKLQPSENLKQSSPASIVLPKAEEISKQITNSNQELLPSRQPEPTLIKSASGDQREIQQTVQTEVATQELSSVTKNNGNATQNAIRFAQPTDLMLSAADSSGKENLSSDSGRQGSQMLEKSINPVSNNPEVISAEISSEKTSFSSLSLEQQPVNLHSVNRSISSDPLKTLVAPEPILPEQIERQVSEKLVTHEFKQGTDQISFKLSPEHLGNIQLNMRMEDQKLKLEIVTESRGTRDALLQQSDSLKETLSRQNIQMDSFTVTTGNSGNLTQQSGGGEWRQATAEQSKNQQSPYKTANISADFESPVRYFAPQYQSTIDVRF